MFGMAKDKLSEDMDSPDEMKAKTAELMDQHAETIEKVTDAIPGEVDDQMVEKVKEALK